MQRELHEKGGLCAHGATDVAASAASSAASPAVLLSTPLPAIVDGTVEAGVVYYKRDGGGLCRANVELLADRDFMLALVPHCGMALAHAAPHITADKTVVGAAVRQAGWALEFASESLRGDPDIVYPAVVDAGWALSFASAVMRQDKVLVTMAVRGNGALLQYASESLRQDADVVAEAVRQKGVEALEYAGSEEVKQDSAVLAALAVAAENVPAAGCVGGGAAQRLVLDDEF